MKILRLIRLDRVDSNITAATFKCCKYIVKIGGFNYFLLDILIQYMVLYQKTYGVLMNFLHFVHDSENVYVIIRATKGYINTVYDFIFWSW